MVFHQPKMDVTIMLRNRRSARNRQGIPTVQAEQILPAFTPDDTVSLGRVETNGSNLADVAGAVFGLMSM